MCYLKKVGEPFTNPPTFIFYKFAIYQFPLLLLRELEERLLPPERPELLLRLLFTLEELRDDLLLKLPLLLRDEDPLLKLLLLFERLRLL